jgi:hypothetical protein
MVNRMLLLVNRSSGLGCRPGIVGDLLQELRQGCGWPEELEVEMVDDHPRARGATRRFLAESREPATVIVAGGGGTLRAAVEGVFDGLAAEPGYAKKVQLGALRMGSGNVVARRFGVAFDAREGMREIAASLRDGRSARCAVIRCRFGTASGGEDVRHAVTMCGLGQFGRTSGDLARWHRRFGLPRKALASIAGIERLNSLEYMLSAGSRLLGATAFPPSCERVEVMLGHRHERFRLLAGAVMNFGVRAIPFDPRVGIEEPAAGVMLLPRAGRLRAWRLGAGEQLRVTLLDRDSVEFFLDEDPERAYGGLTLEVAGTLAFVPGAAYGVPA